MLRVVTREAGGGQGALLCGTKPPEASLAASLAAVVKKDYC